MHMSKQVVGKDADGNDVVMVWGADLNWAHGFVDGPQHQQREYYRAQGRGNAHYLVAREVSREFKYWLVVIHVDGKTQNLPTEFMSAYEGQEVCQIFESERAHVIRGPTPAHEVSKNARARIEDKINDQT
jgi:hypothetical protein